jgi:hypothetical protein
MTAIADRGSHEGVAMKRRLFSSVAASLGLAVLAACNGGGTTPPVLLGHLYVSDRVMGGNHISVFTLPVTNASTPTVTVPVAGLLGGMSLDATRLYVPDLSGAGNTVKAFTLPLTAASTPAFSMTLTRTVEDVKIGAGGNLYAAEPFNSSCCIEAVNAPLSGASPVAFSMTLASAGGNPFGLGFDPSGNLFASGSNQVAEFTPPFSGGQVPTFHFGAIANNWGIISDSTGRVFVANGAVNGKVDVYSPPYTNASLPSFSFTVSASTIIYMAFDASGNLYAAVPNDNKVYVTAPPFSALSTPSVNIAVPNAWGVAIGP